MKLHGKARLILTERETGREVFREEHENTITPALSRIFSANLAGTLDYSKIMPVFSKLLGGVCLFNGTIDAADVFLPKAQDAQLTAHAGQNLTFDAAADPKRGYLNTALSGRTQNGYRWVWQWTTTGNGPISDITLTHADTGDYWNESTPNIMAANFEPVEDICAHNLDGTIFAYEGPGYGLPGNAVTNSKKIPIGFVDDINHIISFEVDEENERFNVYLSKFTGDGAWIWNECGEPYEETMLPFAISKPQQGTWENLGLYMYMLAYDEANKKLYAFTCGWSSGGSWQNTGKIFYYDCLNLADGTVTSGNVDCTSDLGAASFCFISNYSAGNPIITQVVDGSVFLPTNDTQVLRVKLSDMTERELITGLYVTVGNQQTNNGAVNLGNDRICLLNTFGAKLANGTYAGFDIKRTDANNTLFGTEIMNARVYAAEQPTASPVQYFTRTANDVSDKPPRGAILNKLYAASKFHIENGPVVKTASLNMTLEYELIQEVES